MVRLFWTISPSVNRPERGRSDLRDRQLPYNDGPSGPRLVGAKLNRFGDEPEGEGGVGLLERLALPNDEFAGGPGPEPFPEVRYNAPGPRDLEPIIDALDDPMRVSYP